MLAKLLVFTLIPFLLQAIGTEPHHTTAYIGDRGETDVLLSYSHYSTDHFWNKHGDKLPTYNGFNRNSYLMYAEYAINNHQSLFLNGGYSKVEESLNGNSCGLEDIELGWKSLIHAGQTSALTSLLMAIIPAGKKKSSIRYSRTGVEATLLYSDRFCLFKRQGWYDLGIGYRYYQGFPSDQIRLNIALGYQAISSINIIASSLLEYGLFNGKSQDNVNNVVFHPNYRLLKTQIECVIQIFSHAALSLGAFKHLWGRNIGAGGGFFGGIWIDF